MFLTIKKDFIFFKKPLKLHLLPKQANLVFQTVSTKYMQADIGQTWRSIHTTPPTDIHMYFSAQLSRSCLLDLGPENLTGRDRLQSNAVDSLTSVLGYFYT